MLCAGSPQAKYTTRGPRLIEVNSRMGGGQVRENNLAVWGVDLVDESLLSAIGLPNAPPVPREPLTCRSALYFNAQITGTMGEGDWLHEVRGMPGVVYAKLLVGAGETVVCSDHGMPTWLGQLMCDGATPEEAMALVKKYESLVDPPILDKKPLPAAPSVVDLAQMDDGVRLAGPVEVAELPAPPSPPPPADAPRKKSVGGLSAAFSKSK